MRDKQAETRRLAFADLIVRARANAGDWSQEQLADHLKVARSTIARWESARGGTPTLESLLTLINDFGVPGEDVATAVGLIPDGNEERADLDADEQAIWNLGARRHWPEDLRWELIDVYRARQLRGWRESGTIADEVVTDGASKTAMAEYVERFAQERSSSSPRRKAQ